MRNPIELSPFAVRAKGIVALEELTHDYDWLPHTAPDEAWTALVAALEGVGLRVVPLE